MAIFRAATPGTLLCLCGTALLLLSSINAPIVKSLYFLKAVISASSTTSDFSTGGIEITIGTFGYCGMGSCVGPTLGFNLNSDQLLGLYSSYITLPENLIKWLTYVLIVHPIAAGLGAIASLLGIIGHFRELSVVLTLSATWFSGLATTISLIAFVFDIVVFTIVKSRIASAANSADNVNVSAGASYGPSIWMTLAGFLCFAISGCCFNFGRRVARERRADKNADAWRPKGPAPYAERERETAVESERDRRNRASRAERGLPSFAEDVNASNDMAETLPLRSHDYGSDQYQQQYSQNNYSQNNFSRPQEVSGVGYGYGRRNHGTDASGGAAGIGASGFQPSPSRFEPFTGDMSESRAPAMPVTAASRDLYDSNARPSALMPGRTSTLQSSHTAAPVSTGPALSHPQIAHLPNLSSYNPTNDVQPARQEQSQPAMYDENRYHTASPDNMTERAPPTYITQEVEANPYSGYYDPYVNSSQTQNGQHVQGPLRQSNDYNERSWQY